MRDVIKRFTVDALSVQVFEKPATLSRSVAGDVNAYLLDTLNRQGTARVILATGNSQLQFLEDLAGLGGVDWSKVTLFHMDEYLGVSKEHPACFRRYMYDRVEQKLHPAEFHYLDGDALQPIRECDRYECLLREAPIDLCCLGIGDNGHLAFNDPPVADFGEARLVKIVKLDDVCKTQQVNQGHFADLQAVPAYALTLTVPALCMARKMICLCPGAHKAKPVRAALEGPIDPICPASVLRNQSHAVLCLDAAAAGALDWTRHQCLDDTVAH